MRARPGPKLTDQHPCRGVYWVRWPRLEPTSPKPAPRISRRIPQFKEVRHREQIEAIQLSVCGTMDCFAALAMTDLRKHGKGPCLRLFRRSGRSFRARPWKPRPAPGARARRS
jgi:hypothetical protein